MENMKKWMTGIVMLAMIASCGTGGKKNAEVAVEKDSIETVLY